MSTVGFVTLAKEKGIKMKTLKRFWTWLVEHWLYVALVVAIVSTAPGCGLRAPGEPETPIEPPPPPVCCGPAPIPDVKMGYAAGGYWAFDNAEMPYPSESVKTKEDWATGRITFAMTGLDSSLMKSGRGTDFFMFMAMLKGDGGKEVNFHYMNSDGTGRLVMQEFDIGGRLLHDIQNILQGMWWNPAETYSFEFRWDANRVSVTIKDSSGNIIHDGYVRMEGAVESMSYIHVGNGALSQYDGIGATVYVINPVLE